MNWNLIYDFLTGPTLWFAFIFFIGGLFVRIAILSRLSRKKDRDNTEQLQYILNQKNSKSAPESRL